MADVTWTPASTKVTSSTAVEHGVAGATIAPMDVVYLDASDGEYKLADASAAATAVVRGIALHTSLDGQPLAIATGGNLTMAITNSTVDPSQLCVLSATAGKITTVGDLVAGNFTTIIGATTTATNLNIDIHVFAATALTTSIT